MMTNSIILIIITESVVGSQSALQIHIASPLINGNLIKTLPNAFANHPFPHTLLNGHLCREKQWRESALLMDTLQKLGGPDDGIILESNPDYY